MDYILTVLLTIILTFATIKLIGRKKGQFGKIYYRQSAVYELIKDFIPANINAKQPKKTQLNNDIEKNNMRVLVVDNQAYWILNNVFYTADMVDGHINPNTERQVETNDMSQHEINKMLFIVDRLRNGLKNDSGSAGNK